MNKALLTLTAAAIALVAATSASAGGPRGTGGMNGVELNGVNYNGLSLNGRDLNGVQLNGAAQAGHVGLQVLSVTLPAKPAAPAVRGGGEGGMNGAGGMNGRDLNGVAASGRAIDLCASQKLIVCPANAGMSVLSVSLPAKPAAPAARDTDGRMNGTGGMNGVATTGRIVGSWGGPSGSNGVALSGLDRMGGPRGTGGMNGVALTGLGKLPDIYGGTNGASLNGVSQSGLPAARPAASMEVLSVKLPAQAVAAGLTRAGGPSGSMGANGVSLTGLAIR